MPTTLPSIALTAGEPAGIGPDIILQLAQQNLPAHIVVFTAPEVLEQRAAQLNLPIQLNVADTHPPALHQAGKLHIIPISLGQSVQTGQLTVDNAKHVLNMLQQACQMCMTNQFDALVTAPIHKGIINEAGYSFTGHTEFLAQQTNTSQVVMMLATPKLRVALTTTHLPLSQVSQAITREKLKTTLEILHQDLRTKFGITQPHIVICGLNPHAGEDGHLGSEEITTMIPVIKQLQQTEGMHLTGPLPADTAFTPQNLAGVDAVLTMYHDQGLPVLKSQGFGKAVNITLGLPIIRTSVDHGTALPLAGTGRANTQSLEAALNMAIDIVNRKKDQP